MPRAFVLELDFLTASNNSLDFWIYFWHCSWCPFVSAAVVSFCVRRFLFFMYVYVRNKPTGLPLPWRSYLVYFECIVSFSTIKILNYLALSFSAIITYKKSRFICVYRYTHRCLTLRCHSVHPHCIVFVSFWLSPKLRPPSPSPKSSPTAAYITPN